MFRFVINACMLGVGLAMDAFSVSLANGLNHSTMSRKRMNIIAGTFAGFQFLMPMIGWICVHTVVTIFTQVQTLIPWIALILLLYIGGNMIFEGVHPKDETEEVSHILSMHDLVLQGIATSIDALSVGFTIANYDFPEALGASLIIGGVTYVICLAGLMIGRRAGTALSDKASIFGGIILILIGFKIFFGI